MRKNNNNKKSRLVSILLIIIAVIIAVNIFENLSVGVTDYEVDLNSENSEPLRIVQLSDIHMIRSNRQDGYLYRKVLNLFPDVIAITGDLIDADKYSNEEFQRMTVQFCKHLCSIAPVYYVYGNHEIMLLDDPQNNSFKLELEAVGVNILNNKTTVIEKNGVEYNLLGLQDPATLYRDPVYSNKGYRVADILKDMLYESDNDNIHILLSHRPELFKVYTEDYDIDLTLTGHAHGGQFRIPFTDISAYAPNQGFLPKYTSGIYINNGNSMIVSRGIGNSVIPVRIFNMPEIVVIDIK